MVVKIGLFGSVRVFSGVSKKCFFWSREFVIESLCRYLTAEFSCYPPASFSSCHYLCPIFTTTRPNKLFCHFGGVFSPYLQVWCFRPALQAGLKSPKMAEKSVRTQCGGGVFTGCRMGELDLTAPSTFAVLGKMSEGSPFTRFFFF